MEAIEGIFGGLLMVAFVIGLICPFWMIFKKAGFHPGLSVLIGVPLVNLVILYWIAFSKWPARPFESEFPEQEIKKL
jgi:hypothetical protein